MDLIAPEALVVDRLSSASLRILCLLDHKGLALPLREVHLRAGEHLTAAHAALNPAQAVPVLHLADGSTLTQSLAIAEYLDAWCPTPALLPTHALAAARVRSVCQLVASDIHPLTNLRVRAHVASRHGDEPAHAWAVHWCQVGARTLDHVLQGWRGRHACGDTLTLADFFVAPAAFTMQRLGAPVAPQSRLGAVMRHALAHPAFEHLRRAGARA